MHPVIDCDWSMTPKVAIAWQDRMRGRVRLDDTIQWDDLECAAGADVAYSKRTNRCYAGIVLIDVRSGETIGESTCVIESTFPYVPGLLTFREGPALLQAFERMSRDPDLLVFDGQGIAHPRRFGLASHMGVLYDAPSLGIAKSKLCGEHEPPGSDAGDAAALMLDGEQIGWALRSRAGCKPIYISPGHRISMDGSLAAATALLGRCRIPDITRRAHFLTRRLLESNAV